MKQALYHSNAELEEKCKPLWSVVPPQQSCRQIQCKYVESEIPAEKEVEKKLGS